MEEQPLSEADARNLRFLRGLVLVLTATMIVGMVILVVLFATRLPSRESAQDGVALQLPESIALPDGAAPVAITQGQGWWAVVTDADEILIFDGETGALRQRVAVE